MLLLKYPDGLPIAAGRTNAQSLTPLQHVARQPRKHAASKFVRLSSEAQDESASCRRRSRRASLPSRAVPLRAHRDRTRFCSEAHRSCGRSSRHSSQDLGRTTLPRMEHAEGEHSILRHICGLSHGRSPAYPSTIRTIRHGLALRAPEGDARIRPLNAAANCVRRSDGTVRRAPINPQARAWIGLMRRAPLPSAISHDRVAGIFKHIGADQLLRRGNCGLQLLRH